MRINWNVSDAVRKRNPHLFGLGPVPPAKPKRSGLVKPQTPNADQTRGSYSLVISLVSFRHRLLDDDNFVGACKKLRDSIAETLNIDDGSKIISWQYGQIQSTGDEGVLVRIEYHTHRLPR